MTRSNADFSVGDYDIHLSPTAAAQFEALSPQDRGALQNALQTLVQQAFRMGFFFELRDGSPTGTGMLLYQPLLLHLGVSDHRIDVEQVLLVRDPRELL